MYAGHGPRAILGGHGGLEWRESLAANKPIGTWPCSQYKHFSCVTLAVVLVVFTISSIFIHAESVATGD